jgi:outer membrane protein assembly factor BamB
MVLNGSAKSFDQKPTARPPLEKVWEFEADGDVINSAAAYGMVFLGSKDKRVYALNADSGQERWRFEMDKAVRPQTSLVVADDVLYVFGEDRNLYAVDAQTDKMRWRFSTGENIWYSPVIANGIAYVVSKRKKEAVLFAVDVQTGQERWRFSTDRSIKSPVVGCGNVFFSSEDQCVHALDGKSGGQKWVFESGHKNLSRPVVTNEKVLIYGDKDLHALDANSGALLWEFKDAVFSGEPKVVGDAVVLDKELTLVDLASGVEKAKLAPGQIVSVDDVKNGIIYSRCAEGTLCAFDFATGEFKWYAVVETRAVIGGLRPFSWTASEEFVFATAGISGKTYGINISNFAKRWESPAAFGYPTVYGEMVFASKGRKMCGYVCSKDPASQSLLEIGDKVAPNSTYTGSVLFFAFTKSFMGGGGKLNWPGCCCLCCGPVEKRVNLAKTMDRVTLSAEGIPYCATCYGKTTGIFKKEKPAVEIIHTAPPTFAFRNEKYWAMFMKANRAR